MRNRVALETQGRVDVEEIERALASCGAEGIRLDPRAGDSGEGVGQYFFFEFRDGLAGGRTRVAKAFHALPSSESEAGWTRFELGADDRARAMVEALAESVGGWMIDERDGQSRLYDAPCPGIALAA